MFDLPEKVTIWNQSGGSSYEGYSWDGPHVISSRTAQRFKKVVDSKGQDVMSDHAVYFEDVRVTISTKIFLGESQALTPPNESRDVIQLAKTPSGTNMRVAYL